MEDVKKFLEIVEKDPEVFKIMKMYMCPSFPLKLSDLEKIMDPIEDPWQKVVCRAIKDYFKYNLN